jgi:hypothetical protein
MFNIDDIKKQAAEKIQEKGDDISSKVLTIKENIGDSVESTKESVNSLKMSIGETVEHTKGAVKDFSVIDKIKDFSFNATTIVSEIDNHLVDQNIPYEVSSFRVSANVGVVAGMILDINFTKTAHAKKNSDEIRSTKSSNDYLQITNPKTGKTYKIVKSTVADKEEVKIRDSETGEILVANAKTGEIIRIE